MSTDGESAGDRRARRHTAPSIRGGRNTSARLFTQQVSVFLLLQIIDQADVLIGDPLHVFQRTPLVVFRDLVVLEELLEAIVGVAAHLADGVAAFLRVLVD